MYGLYYEKEAISKQLYEWLLKNGYADAMLIAKWKKTGYEKVCYVHFSYLEIVVFQRFVQVCIACANDAGFTVMLPPMRANEGNKLQLYMYMSGP